MQRYFSAGFTKDTGKQYLFVDKAQLGRTDESCDLSGCSLINNTPERYFVYKCM
jgi:hypothetical protein